MISGLPYDAEVEYLQTVSRAYIETGIIPPSSSTVKWCGYVGFASGSIRRRFLYADQNQSVAHYSEINGSDKYGGGASYAQVQLSPETMYFATTEVTALRNSVEIEVDGVKYQASSTSYASTEWGQIVLFRLNNNYIGEGQRLGSTRIYVNDGLKRDFVPVRFTNSNGQSEGAMYDRVSRKLFRNAGTGAFTIGPDVATPVMGLHFMPKPKLSARNYVQDGLIAMWDGIENVGWGQHDEEATTWKDLVGGRIVTLGNGTSFTSNSLTFSAQGVSTGSSITGQIVAIEFVEFHSVRQDALPFQLQSGRQCVVVSRTDSYTFSQNVTDSSMPYQFGVPHAVYVALSSDGAIDTCYIDGIVVTNQKRARDANIGFYGMRMGGATDSYFPYSGSLYALRVRSGALTPAEIAANYAVDKERFNLP